MLEYLRIRGLALIDDLCFEGVVGLVLHGPAAVQGQMLGAGHIGIHNGLDLAAVPQSVVAGERANVSLPPSRRRISQSASMRKVVP